jgi:hypothetical protein
MKIDYREDCVSDICFRFLLSSLQMYISNIYPTNVIPKEASKKKPEISVFEKRC